MEYNGWTNYATWRVKLENFDDTTELYYYWDSLGKPNAYDFGQQLKENIENTIEEQTEPNNIAQDYAFAFINDVNWTEIADALLDDFQYEDGYELKSYS